MGCRCPHDRRHRDQGYRAHNEFGQEKVWDLDEHGRPGKVADFSFNSEEGRQRITIVAGRLGLKQKQPASVIFGIVMAIIAVGGLIVLGVGVLIWLLFIR